MIDKTDGNLQVLADVIQQNIDSLYEGETGFVLYIINENGEISHEHVTNLSVNFTPKLLRDLADSIEENSEEIDATKFQLRAKH